MCLISALWKLPSPCSWYCLFGASVWLWPDSGLLTVFSTSWLLPLLAHLLTALPHILDNFTALTFQLTHPLFRLSDLLISLSIELILQRFFFISTFFFFPNPSGLFIVFCSLHMFLTFVLNFFKHRKKLAGSCFITCLLILASYIYMGLFLADSCLWDLFKLFLNCAIFLGKLFVGVLWGLGRRYISHASRNRR